MYILKSEIKKKSVTWYFTEISKTVIFKKRLELNIKSQKSKVKPTFRIEMFFFNKLKYPLECVAEH